MSSPPFRMRNILHKRAQTFIGSAIAASCGISIAYFMLYAEPRRKKYEKFFEFNKHYEFRTYDPYQRMREICAYPVKFLHTCPSELVKKAEEKGLQIGSMTNSYTQPTRHNA